MTAQQQGIITTSPDGTHKPRRTRTTILAVACLVILAALFIGYLPGLQYAINWTLTDVVFAGISFLICMVYSTELSSVPVASRHTAIPLLTTMLLITGGFDHLFSLLIVITLICTTISERSLSIGAIRACTALAPIPVVRLILSESPAHLREIFISSVPRAEALNYILSNWVLPLIIITALLPVVRLLCDIVVYLVCGVPVVKSLSEYSITRIITLSLADLAAIVVTILLPAVFQYSDVQMVDSSLRSIFSISLDVYALALMSFYMLRRMMRAENSLRCLLNISDALPLPNARPEQKVAEIITGSLPNIRCIMMTDDKMHHRPFHSYRHSQRIKAQGSQYSIVFERSMMNRPFLPADEEVLAAAASILNEELRVNREVSTLRSESETDPLTGAYTYSAFIATLKSLQTENASNKVAVIYLNIDQFRRINGRYSRLVGNLVLRTTADRIREILPEDAFLSRISGSEFATVFTESTSEDDIENLADRLRDNTSLPIQTSNGTISIATTTSLSFASSDEGATRLLIDAGLHELAPAMAEQNPKQSTKDHLEMSDALRDAIEKNHLALLYQPIFSLPQQRISALEMFPLITDSRNHRLDFDFVLSEAQRLGLGCKLSMGILDRGVKDLLEFRKIAPDLNNICLTLNGSELGNSQFYEHLESLRERHPDITVCLQFGEAALNTARIQFDDELEDLTSMSNVRIAITQAGTTYSEVSAMANIPLGIIKLDPSIVNGYSNPLAVNIMKHTVQFAHRDGIHLVFDGIDTIEQTRLLHEVGGTEAQGTVYASMMTASEMRMRLETMGINMGSVESGQADVPAGVSDVPGAADSTAADASPEAVNRPGKKNDGNDITKPSYDL
ncbi:MAG: EAL domain-containing protein [Bifidobacterium sp.]|uniref:EAL domain-containing protein n=1 Tax=Bifidobacterium sp. TaxID=41200 RepID=UPI003EFD0608